MKRTKLERLQMGAVVAPSLRENFERNSSRLVHVVNAADEVTGFTDLAEVQRVLFRRDGIDLHLGKRKRKASSRKQRTARANGARGGRPLRGEVQWREAVYDHADEDRRISRWWGRLRYLDGVRRWVPLDPAIPPESEDAARAMARDGHRIIREQGEAKRARHRERKRAQMTNFVADEKDPR